ncbi:glycine cleavage T C-terminal barrel domain-containing protein [Candidatus Margulisiibacteriota bacterium]
MALAYLSGDQKEVQIDIRGQKVAAKVVAKTFYKR